MFSPSSLLRIALPAIAVSGAGATASAWTPPIGIPAPSFGIEQTTTETSFTHWVDNSGVCSNSTNGTPALPRCSFPATLPAGSIVQVRGGPYALGDEFWLLNGTATQPVFVRGPSTGPRPFLGADADVEISGSYGIVENLSMPRFTFGDGSANHDLALRHSTVSDHPGTGAAVFARTGNHHIVIYGCEIARNGTIPSGADNHGIALHSNGISDVWIVDNHIHHNSGDAIQFCHGCTVGPARVYVGRNELHQDEENALDLKEFLGPVVVSQNKMWGYRDLTSGAGEAIRVNDEGAQGELWIMFNDIYDSSLAVNAFNADSPAIYIIGNEIHNITTQTAAAIDGTPQGGSAVMQVVNNTIVNVTRGILVGEAKSNIVKATGVAIGAEVTGCSHNLVQQGTIQPTCTNGRSGDPKLVMSGTHVMGLQADSPAIDVGFANHGAYSTFQSGFGRSISFDRVGVSRPQGAGWDIGAHELPVDAGDLIFKDGFETGDVSRWSSAQTDGTDVTVIPPGMAGTTWASSELVDDTNGLYVQDNSPDGERRYRARFYVDPSLFDPGTAQGHLRTRILLAFSELPTLRVVAIVLRKRFGQYSIMGRARLDDETRADTAFFPISPGPHAIEFELTAANGPSAGDGTFTLWIDGGQAGPALTGLVNNWSVVDFVRMGALSVKPGAAGVLRFDEFESRKQTYIGTLP
jgi:hypothetical protein